MKKLLLFSFMIISYLHANAQIVLTLDTYLQNFDTYAGSAATVPAGWTTVSSGTQSFRGTGNGTSGSAGDWAYGTGSDFSMGSLTNGGTGAITFCVSFQNNTGETITAMDITYRFEQWRYGNNTVGFTVAGTGALSSVDLSALNQVASSSGTNGNQTFAFKTTNIAGINITQGGTFGVCFDHANGNGNNAGISVDNFLLSLITALPISLKTFEAKAMSPTAVELVWVTESEENNHYYEAQHSTDGQNFESFNKINGAGTSSQINQYSVLHEEAQRGVNYYRIKQVDFDGQFSYTPIRAVEVKGGNHFSLFPNLTEDELHLVLPDFISRKGKMEIYGINGFKYRELLLNEGDNHLLIDVSDLIKGFYFVRVISDGEEAFLKFIKQ